MRGKCVCVSEKDNRRKRNKNKERQEVSLPCWWKMKWFYLQRCYLRYKVHRYSHWKPVNNITGLNTEITKRDCWKKSEHVQGCSPHSDTEWKNICTFPRSPGSLQLSKVKKENKILLATTAVYQTYKICIPKMIEK